MVVAPVRFSRRSSGSVRKPETLAPVTFCEYSVRLPFATPTLPTAPLVNAVKGLAPTRPSTFEEGMKLVPFASACAGVVYQPTRFSVVPPVRAQVAVTLTPLKLLLLELSLMLARLTDGTSVLRAMLVFRVALSATVTGPLDVNPTWACKVVAPTRASAVAPASTRVTRCIARLRSKGWGRSADNTPVVP